MEEEDEQEYDDKKPLIGRIVFVLMLCFVLYACFTPSTQPKPKPTTAKKVIINTYPYPSGGGSNGGGGAGGDTTSIDFVVRAFQTIREGGVKFRFEALAKSTGSVLDGVTYTFTNLEPSIPIVNHGNYFIGQNNDGGNTRANVTLARNGISKTREWYSSTGNHDGHSINCDDNQNNLISSNYSVAQNSIITLTWQGTFADGQSLLWYGDSFDEINRTDKTITIKLNQFPFWIQAQPTAVSSNNFCHGWTGIYFA